MASMGMAGWLQLAGTASSLWGSMEGSRIARAGAARAQVTAEFNAWNLERQAGIALALAQREAMEERRLGDIAASRALAVAAASGGGVQDPTIVRLLASTKGEAAYRASVALYEGEERGRQLRHEATFERIGGAEALAEGKARSRAYTLQGLGTAARGGVSLYAKYGGGGPSGDAALISDSYNPRNGPT